MPGLEALDRRVDIGVERIRHPVRHFEIAGNDQSLAKGRNGGSPCANPERLLGRNDRPAAARNDVGILLDGYPDGVDDVRRHDRDIGPHFRRADDSRIETVGPLVRPLPENVIDRIRRSHLGR